MVTNESSVGLIVTLFDPCGATARSAVQAEAASPESMARTLFADPSAVPREMHIDLRVLVNGRSIAFLDGLDTRLRADDAVTLHLSGARGYPGG